MFSSEIEKNSLKFQQAGLEVGGLWCPFPPKPLCGSVIIAHVRPRAPKAVGLGCWEPCQGFVQPNRCQLGKIHRNSRQHVPGTNIVGILGGFSVSNAQVERPKGAESTRRDGRANPAGWISKLMVFTPPWTSFLWSLGKLVHGGVQESPRCWGTAAPRASPRGKAP